MLTKAESMTPKWSDPQTLKEFSNLNINLDVFFITSQVFDHAKWAAQHIKYIHGHLLNFSSFKNHSYDSLSLSCNFRSQNDFF